YHTSNSYEPGDLDALNPALSFDSIKISGSSGTLPGSPSTPVPSDNASLTSQPTILDWADDTNAQSYDVYFDNLSPINVLNSQWTVNQSLLPGQHTWHVTAKNAAGSTSG